MSVPAQWSNESGTGSCRVRSANFGKNMGHLFTCAMTIGHDRSVHCSWCWKQQ